jgi:cytoskeletal protein CcmA (bactofilin family)
MWTSNEAKSADSAQSVVEMPGTLTRTAHSPTVSQHSMIGKSIRIKGEIAAADPVYIYGSVEGTISAPAHRVTVGKEGMVKADITAREVVVMGEVCGNVNGGDRVEIRSEGSLTGDLATHRIVVEDGAIVTGSVDIRKLNKKAEVRDESELTLVETSVAKEPDGDKEEWADLAVSEIA